MDCVALLVDVTRLVGVRDGGVVVVESAVVVERAVVVGELSFRQEESSEAPTSFVSDAPPCLPWLSTMAKMMEVPSAALAVHS